ncbi:MAG: HAD family phosphatase [Nanoarchaeota archaeon]|nr:HAD family phosphatase [Nanoarchaeota archaeon]
MIKAILFDFGGVLVNPSTYIFRRAAREFNLDRAQLHELIDKVVAKLEVGSPLKKEQKRLEDVVRHPIPLKTFLDVFVGEYRRHLKANINMAKFVRSLAKHYQVGVISNIITEHAAINRRHGLYKGFDVVALSNELGIRKPNPAIYRYVMKRLKRKPEECVFTDDLPENVESARQLDMHAFQFHNIIQLKRDLKELGVHF